MVRFPLSLRLCVLSLFASTSALAQAPSPQPAPVVKRMAVPEAHQGAASDGTFAYAIDNDRIGKYRLSDGAKVDQWQGERRLFPHMNSCTVVDSKLYCAASNYPAVPQTSAIEIFSTSPLKHDGTVSLGFGPGSLTVIDRHDGKWWAVFANYAGKGGEPGRDYRYTMLARMDDHFRIEQTWAFPKDVLARMAPMSCSGLSWGPDGLIYATGHDRPEVYAMRLPEAGSQLELVGTLGIATPGQAIDWDPKAPRRLWSIARDRSEMVASDMPEVLASRP
ncbi:hypothetical protein [Novosphingobium guangzhouense]|uniref:Uncharacterized protein n=1 Tax=Novosphingobium guangzhouense TaxID=1850347 RepID=A0A2K2G6K7_9SPHN|nr:hypothetical protein [Novosphingobium guangzhouense]PNU06659.1 hypothetical protein A8V01_00220 [Novosphingobium guangzhouense]